MLNLRRQPRLLTLKTGKILIGRSAPQIECAILNIHGAGACILVPDPADIPETFELVIDNDRKIFTCRVVWKAGHRIGVSLEPTIMIDTTETRKADCREV
jgi:hypothetical protein